LPKSIGSTSSNALSGSGMSSGGYDVLTQREIAHVPPVHVAAPELALDTPPIPALGALERDFKIALLGKRLKRALPHEQAQLGARAASAVGQRAARTPATFGLALGVARVDVEQQEVHRPAVDDERRAAAHGFVELL